MDEAIDSAILNTVSKRFLANFFIDKINYTLNAWDTTKNPNALTITNGRFKNDPDLLWVPDNTVFAAGNHSNSTLYNCNMLLYIGDIDTSQVTGSTNTFGLTYPHINREITFDLTKSTMVQFSPGIEIINCVNANTTSNKVAQFYIGYTSDRNIIRKITGVDLSYSTRGPEHYRAPYQREIVLVPGSKVRYSNVFRTSGESTVNTANLHTFYTPKSIFDFITHSYDYNNPGTQTDAQGNIMSLQKDTTKSYSYKSNSSSIYGNYYDAIVDYVTNDSDAISKLNQLIANKQSWFTGHNYDSSSFDTVQKKIDAYLLSIGWEQLFDTITVNA